MDTKKNPLKKSQSHLKQFSEWNNTQTDITIRYAIHRMNKRKIQINFQSRESERNHSVIYCVCVQERNIECWQRIYNKLLLSWRCRKYILYFPFFFSLFVWDCERRFFFIVFIINLNMRLCPEQIQIVNLY